MSSNEDFEQKLNQMQAQHQHQLQVGQQQMQQQEQQHRAEIERLHALLTNATLSSNVSSSVPSAASTAITVPSSYKPKNPDFFEGDSRSRGKTFINEMEQFFLVTNMPAASKVNVFANHLKRNAMVWFTALRNELQDKSEHERAPLIHWDAFKERFLAHYHPVEMSTTARMKLYNLKQTGNVSAYCDLFNRLLLDVIDMSITDQLHCFRQGLAREIALVVTMNKPTTVAEAMQYAQVAEVEGKQWHGARNSASGGSSKKMFNRGRGNGGAGGSGTAGGSTAMDLSHVNVASNSGVDGSEEDDVGAASDSDEKYPVDRSANVNYVNAGRNHGGGGSGGNNKARTPGLSRDEFQRCFKGGLCFNCKKPGHLKKDCTQSKK